MKVSAPREDPFRKLTDGTFGLTKGNYSFLHGDYNGRKTPIKREDQLKIMNQLFRYPFPSMDKRAG
jgi:hypothetical protein